MAYALRPFAEIGLNEALLRFMLEEHEGSAVPEYERFWSYYRNPVEPIEVQGLRGRETRWCSAQESGLPSRLRQRQTGLEAKEIVIENDIAWRLETLVNYVTGGGVRILSNAADRDKRAQIEAVAQAILEANGGEHFLQNLTLLASIYGQVDLILRVNHFYETKPLNSFEDGVSPSGRAVPATVLARAGLLKFELIEAPRAIPFLDPHDYRRVLAYVVTYRRWSNEIEEPNFLQRTALRAGLFRGVPARQRSSVVVTEILSANARQVYEDEELVLDEVNVLGVLPMVHIQNLVQPYFYEGLSEVEPLISLQDELNTRLSDRANRVTLQSFKMYLGKGIEGFGERPIAPGQMWMTENPEASIESFGGDAASPSEDRHIDDVRAALDKASSVSPLAAGLLRNKVGTLSSENALRISLLGLLAKTERKRQAITEGLRSILTMAFMALDQTGDFATDISERGLEIVWESPLPADETKQLENALIKRDLGVPAERILAELGYATVD